jgi:predicted DNA binding CopG/RHH family protein
MKYYELDKEEKEILGEFETGKTRRVKNVKEEKAKLEQSARATLQKTKNINIRLSEQDIFKLKSKALEEGLPYQTYLGSLIHKGLHAR